MRKPIDIFALQVAAHITDSKSKRLCELKHRRITDHIAKSCSEILGSYKDATLCKGGTIPRTIWTLWYQTDDPMPLIPSACVQHMSRLDGFELRFLTKRNIADYIDMSDMDDLLNLGTLSIQTYSDVLRSRLLYQYGGFWIDSTMAILDPSELDNISRTEAFFTLKASSSPRWRHIGNMKWSSYFIAGQKGNPFFNCLDRCLVYFIKTNQGILDYLQIDYTINAMIKSVPAFKEVIVNTPYSCPEASELATRLNDPLELAWYESYSKDNPFAKLSWKIKEPTPETPDGNETFWGHIVRNWGLDPNSINRGLNQVQ